MLAMRITKKYISKNEEKFKEFILDKCEKMFIVLEHEETNVHYQGIIGPKSRDGTSQKSRRDRFVKVLKEYFGLKGNQSYSIKKVDGPDRYMQYLCKGDKEDEPVNIVLNNMLCEGNIDDYHRKYWLENNKIKKEGKDKISMMMRYDIGERGDKPEGLYYMEKIIKYHLSKNLLIPDEYMIKKYVNTIQFRIAAEHDEVVLDTKIKKLYKKIYGIY